MVNLSGKEKIGIGVQLGYNHTVNHQGILREYAR